MTDPNKNNPRPAIVTIRCPRCAGEAEFRPAFWFSGKHNQDWIRAHRWPWSTDIKWGTRTVVQNDSDLYPWKAPGRGGYRTGDEGICQCVCSGRFKHELNWPSDARYRFDVREGVLWAWTREHALALLKFIESKRRVPEREGRYYLFLHHIPAVFLKASRREATAKVIRRSLQSSRFWEST